MTTTRGTVLLGLAVAFAVVVTTVMSLSWSMGQLAAYDAALKPPVQSCGITPHVAVAR